MYSASAVPVVAIGTTVLVVEDNVALAETCVAIFSGAGYRVLTARDGVAALEVLRREEGRVAAVLSDVIRPRLSGVELASRLALDYPNLRDLNPRIVLASISSQGESGPNRLHASYGSTLPAAWPR